MHRREVKVQLSDIQEKFPLSTILQKTLIVNARDMTMISNKEKSNNSNKPRQTARKSTNSKLKQISTNILDTLSIDVGASESGSSEKNVKSNDDSVFNGLDKSKPASTRCSNPTSDDTISILSSTILQDNKIKIMAKKSNTKDSAKAPTNLNSSDKSSEDVSDKSQIQPNKNCSSDGNNLLPPEPMEVSTDSSSAVYTCTSTSTSSDVGSTSNTVEKQPIKLVLSAVKGHSIVQNSTSNNSNSNSLTDSQHQVSDAEKQSSQTTLSNENCLELDTLKVSPLKIVQNGKLEVVKNCNKKHKSNSIETVVQTLNSKQVSTKKETTKAESTINLKRQASCNDKDETVCKKAKPTIFKTELNCTDDDTVAKDSSNNVDSKILTKVEDKKFNIENGGGYHLSVKDVQPQLEKFVKETVQRELDLKIKLEHKSKQYEKLKEKYESVEKNFQSWIDFANKLQARVKKVAYALHKQQGNVKTIQNKKIVEKRSVLCQTDPALTQQQVGSDVKPSSSQLNRSSHDASTGIFQIFPKQIKTSPSKVAAMTSLKQMSKSLSDIIDLTDECAPMVNKGQNRLASMNHQALAKQPPNPRKPLTQQVTPPSKVPPPSKMPPKVFTSVLAGPNNSSRAGQTIALNRVHVTTKPLHQQTKPSPVYGNNTSKYLPKNALCSNAVCYGDQRARIYQNQTVSSSRNVQSSNPAYRTNSAPIAGKMSQSHMQRKAVAQLKNLPYPPLPVAPPTTCRIPPNALGPPPELLLAIKQNNGGIVLSWSNFRPNAQSAEVKGYELYAFQENSKSDKKEWRKIGEDTITAMDLPMACTLTQFSSSFVYYFAVRGKDVFGRFGPFSVPCTSKDLFS